MMCSCPKCQANIEVDLSRIPEEGTLTSCPECKKRFWTGRESHARRALKKEGGIYCDKCGNLLDHSIVCRACGVMYPDYFLVQASRPPRRQIEKAGFSINFTLKPAAKSYSYTAAKKTAEKSSKSLFITVGLLVLVVAAAVAGVVSYQNMKAQQQYALNFVRALYVIKTGTDLSLKTCAKLSADWQAKLSAGQNIAPRVSVADETDMKTVKVEIDKYMQSLSKPPEKFLPANDKLARLHGINAKLYSLTVTPSGSLPAFADSVAKSENDFKLAAQELKAGLPAMLAEELNKAKTRYKGLQNF